MKNKIINFFIVPFIVTFIMWLSFFKLNLFPRIRNITKDIYINRFAETDFSDIKIIIISRDDLSYSYFANHIDYTNIKNSLAKWRKINTEVLKKIIKFSPDSVALDYIFEEKTIPEIDKEFENSIKAFKDKNIPVVLATKIYRFNGNNNTNSKITYKIAYPYKELINNVFSCGFVNLGPQSDGVIRSAPLVIKEYIENKGLTNLYSFDLNIFYTVFDMKPSDDLITLEVHNKLVNFLKCKVIPDNEEIPDDEKYFKIPCIKNNRRIELNISFAGPTNTFPILPIYTFIDEREWEKNKEKYKKLIEGSIVLFGTTALEDQDFVITPMNIENQEKMSGIELHANVISTMLKLFFKEGTEAYGATYIDIPRNLEGLIFFPLVLLFYYIFYVLKLRYSLFLLIIFSIILLTVQLFLFLNKSSIRYFFDPVTPIFGIFINFVAALGTRFVNEQKEKLKIKRMFSNYVNKSVVESLLKDPSKLKLGGEKKNLTVLFSDVAGFTSISESMNPEALVKLLNEYLSEMTEIVLESDGLLDKYIGDAIMAVWGTPIALPDHPERACKSALKMMERLIILQKKWKKKNLPEINIRIGINTGEMVVGNIGSTKRMDYTVMGDAVNLASRLEGTNKQYGTKILISEFTYVHIKHKFLTREIDSVRVKGKLKPVKIYELISEKKNDNDETPDYILLFEEGLKLYKNKKWDEAILKFKEVLKLKSDDPVSITYIKRCEEFKKNPPPDNWDGVYVMKTK